MSGYHAKNSPSSSPVWGALREACTASVTAQIGLPDNAVDETYVGTTLHTVCAEVLGDGHDLDEYLGRIYVFWFHAESDSYGENWREDIDDTMAEHVDVLHETVIDEEMLDACAVALRFVAEIIESTDGIILIEERLPIDHITDEGAWVRMDTGLEVEEGRNDPTARVHGCFWSPATGASDITILTRDTCYTIDLKFGRRRVDAFEIIEPATDFTDAVIEPNSQIAMYNSAARRAFDYMADFKHCTLIIVQPFLHHVSEYTCTADQMQHTLDRLRARAHESREAPVFAPTHDNCFYCRAAGRCAAQTNKVLSMTVEDNGFLPVMKDIDPAELGRLFELAPLAAQWAKTVIKLTNETVASGTKVYNPQGLRYKPVRGRKGKRFWTDELAVKKYLKETVRLRDDQMYKQSLLTPAALGELAEQKRNGATPLIGPTQWDRLQDHIDQPEGKLVLVLETDPRPEVIDPTVGFEDVPDQE